MQSREPLILLMIGMFLLGCTANHDPSIDRISGSGYNAKTILVTFPVTNFRDRPASTGTRTYISNWRVPLYTRNRVRQLTSNYNLYELDAWPILSLKLYCVAFAVPADTDVATLLDELQADPIVHGAQENHHFAGMTTTLEHYDDPLFDVQYGQYATSVHSVHTTSTGRNVRIGVIDSNVDTNHPDLRGQIHKNYQLVNPTTQLSLLHGTAVAGIIGAVADNGEGVVGLAPGAELFIYGACGGHKLRMRCTSFALAKAFAHALDDDIDILNVSLAGPQDPLLQELIIEAIDRDVIVIAANNSSDTQRNFPANHKDVHAAVGDRPLWFARAEQMSTQAGGGYQIFTGTSITAAGLSGGAALLRSHYTAAETNDFLRSLNSTACGTGIASGPLPIMLAADGCL